MIGEAMSSELDQTAARMLESETFEEEELAKLLLEKGHEQAEVRALRRRWLAAVASHRGGWRRLGDSPETRRRRIVRTCR
jgi:hypothetical protein